MMEHLVIDNKRNKVRGDIRLVKHPMDFDHLMSLMVGTKTYAGFRDIMTTAKPLDLNVELFRKIGFIKQVIDDL